MVALGAIFKKDLGDYCTIENYYSRRGQEEL
jgi:hypothetical protein